MRSKRCFMKRIFCMLLAAVMVTSLVQVPAKTVKAEESAESVIRLAIGDSHTISNVSIDGDVTVSGEEYISYSYGYAVNTEENVSSGKYLIVPNSMGGRLDGSVHFVDGTGSSLAFQNQELGGAEEYWWNIQAVDNDEDGTNDGYTIQSSNDKFMKISSLGLADEEEVLQLTRTNDGDRYFISHDFPHYSVSDGGYNCLNNSGQGNRTIATYHADNGSKWYLYKPNSITITGESAGTTTLRIGETTYTIEVHKEALPKPNLSIAEPVVGDTLGNVEYADYTEAGIKDTADSPATLTTEGLTTENVDGYQAFNGKITAADAETNNGKFDVYGNTPLLIRFKVYVPSGITDSQTLIGKTDNQYGIQVAGTEEGTELKLYANHNDTVWSETNLIIRTDAWHDVIATYTYDTGLNLFVDGDEGAQRDQPTVPTDISGYELQQNRSNNFAIGYNNSDSNSNSNIDSRKFEGKLADVVMYTGDQVPTITSETTADDIKAALATKTPMFELDVTAESGTKPNYTITNTVWTNAAGEEVESLNTAGVNTVTATLTPNEGYAFTDENKPTTMALAGTENTVAVSSATINEDGTMTVSCQFDGSLILQKDNLEAAIAAAEKVLALNPSDETAKESLRTAIASAKNELVSGNATTGSLNEVTNSLTRSVNAVVAVKGNTGTGYTVTVFGGGTLKHAGDNELTAGTTEQDGLNYNDKVIVSAPTESEKGEFVGWEVLGDIVGKGTLDRETKTYQYTFYVPNNVTITAVYGTADEEPTATMTNVVVTANGDNADKVDMKFVGQLTVPDGYKLKNAGLVYMVNNKSDAPTVTADGINEAEGWTYKQVEKVNASYQYSVTFKGATPAQENGTPNYLYAAVYAQFVKLDENGNETEEFTWVSSKPVQVNAKVTE